MSRADRLAKGQYWDRSWNPFTGCSPVGDACLNCWAKRMATRLKGRCDYPADEPFRPTFHPERLSQVNSRQKPQVIALCFMSDPFHEAHDIVSRGAMKKAIIRCPQHTFIAPTKRPEIMRDSLEFCATIPNLVGGVSIWDQPSADRMIPILLETNLTTRIVSLEPCLGAVDLGRWLRPKPDCKYIDPDDGTCLADKPTPECHAGEVPCPESAEWGGLDGVILGGESGPGARPMRPDWARSVRDQCQAAGVPFYFKQWGEWGIAMHGENIEAFKSGRATGFWLNNKWHSNLISPIHGLPMIRTTKKAAGRLLDGRTWDGLPEAFHVR